MKISKIMGKKAAVIAIAAAGMLIAGSASAAGVAIAGAASQTPTNYLLGWNNSAGCVYFHANGRYTGVKPGAWSNLGVTGRNKNYDAVVTDRACGQLGGRRHTVTFNTSNATTVKNHTRGWNFNWAVY